MSTAEAAGAREPPGRLPPARELLWAYLGLAVLWTFAVAQPLFALLKDNPEFFAARGSSGFDVISFSVLLVVLPPALGLAIETVAGLAGPRPRQVAHLILIAGADRPDRRPGAQEVGRGLGHGVDRPLGGHRRGRGGALRSN